jgi:DNA-binding transcriptional LysR family regulator
VVVKMGVAGAPSDDCPALGPGVPSVARTARNAVTATLGDRVVDVTFRAVADESSGFVSIPLASSSLAVVCHPDHALAGHAAVDLRALSGSALAGYPLGWEVRTLSDRALRGSGVEPRYASR